MHGEELKGKEIDLLAKNTDLEEKDDEIACLEVEVKSFKKKVAKLSNLSNFAYISAMAGCIRIA